MSDPADNGAVVREAYDAGKRGDENPHPDLVIWWLMGCQDR